VGTHWVNGGASRLREPRWGPRCRRQGPRTGAGTVARRGTGSRAAGAGGRAQGAEAAAGEGGGRAAGRGGGRTTGRTGAAPSGPRPRRGVRTGGKQGSAQGKKGEGERKREREGEGSSPRGSKFRRSPSPKPRAPRGERERERERWEREGGCCTGELNEGKGPGEGAHIGEGTTPGARGPSWAALCRAGLGRIAGQNPVARTTTDRNPNAKWKSQRDETNTRLNTTSDKEICFGMMQHP
jgi:hypothetical protein